MKKIIIAGAGHGGLVAAYHLADKGYDVTVLESKARKEMGHDWHDFLEYGAFDNSGIPGPEENTYGLGIPSGFTNPAETRLLRAPFTQGKTLTMDRKLLINYLIKLAQEKGVKITFGVSVCSAITEGEKVIGVKTEKNGKIKYEYCDMVIDSAGMFSPVRRSLPKSCGIQKELKGRDVFNVYRVYYENITGEELDPPYQIKFFNMGRPGIDWILTQDGRVDILIGKFASSGELTDEEIEASLEKFRRDHSFIGDKIIRGGHRGVIPIRRMLPIIVCDGYAAIGDCAGMTVPINGSGIVLSMNAGKILADTIIEAKEKELTKEILWKYEYEYFTKHGKDLLFVDVLKNLFTTMQAHQIDYMIENEVLTEKQLAVGDGEPLEITPEYIMHILSVMIKKFRSSAHIVYNLKSIPFIEIVAGQIPETYDEKKIKEWAKKYNAL